MKILNFRKQALCFYSREIPISKIKISKYEKRKVKAVLSSGELVQGNYVNKFENSFSEIHNEFYSVAVNSGTSALHLGLLGLRLPEGSEVLCPVFTFAASANAIKLAGLEPVFVDVDLETFNISIESIRAKITKKTRAILVVHLYGLPANMPEIMKIARKNNLFVIEDCAQAPIASIENKLVGTFGDVAAFSFYATKNITTAEGGMILSKHSAIADFSRKMRNQGMIKKYENELVGFNLRMSEIQATLGICQLKKLKSKTEMRIRNADFFQQRINQEYVFKPKVPNNYKHVFHQYTLRTEHRDILQNQLSKLKIGYGIYYPLILTKLKQFKSKLNFTNAGSLQKSVISIPVHPYLSKTDLNRIVRAINDFK